MQRIARKILDTTGTRGGLIVHVGCGTGKLTAALLASESYLVHGLDADPASVEKARRHIPSLDLSGKVSVDRFDGRRLPYIENPVNLVVAEDPHQVTTDELLRVLAPRGVAYVKEGGRWTKTVKPRPDEWTHYLHDPTNNAVAKDTVIGPPRRYQWIGSPRYSRRLVAVGNVVYVTLGLDAPLVALDAATGQILRTYESTGATEEILVSDGVLILLAEPDGQKPLAA